MDDGLIFILSYRRVGWITVDEWETLGIYHERGLADQTRNHAVENMDRVEFRIETWDISHRIGRVVDIEYC